METLCRECKYFSCEFSFVARVEYISKGAIKLVDL